MQLAVVQKDALNSPVWPHGWMVHHDARKLRCSCSRSCYCGFRFCYGLEVEGTQLAVVQIDVLHGLVKLSEV